MRFTLKTMMVAVLVAALLCCIFFTLPGPLAIAVLGFFWLFAPPALIAGIVYGRGYGRAFSIGCVSAGGCMPLFWMYLWIIVAFGGGDLAVSLDEESAAGIKIGLGILFMFAGLSGLASMTVRWLSLKMAVHEFSSQPDAEYSVLHRRVATVQTEPPADVHQTLPAAEGN